jgi:hypothetical protein
MSAVPGEDEFDALRESTRRPLGGAEPKLGGNDETRADRRLADLDDACRDDTLGPTNEIGDHLAVEQGEGHGWTGSGGESATSGRSSSRASRVANRPSREAGSAGSRSGRVQDFSSEGHGFRESHLPEIEELRSEVIGTKSAPGLFLRADHLASWAPSQSVSNG